jgi:DNA-binding NarL/FixJ family response regulator
VIRLAIVDDHPAIASAIAAAVRDRPDIEIVGTATTAAAALDVVDDARPDVVLCDLWLDGEAAGLDVLAALTGPGRRAAPRVLVLSGFDQPSFLRAAFDGGAAGYLSKASPVEAIVEAIVAVARGAARCRAVRRAEWS